MPKRRLELVAPRSGEIALNMGAAWGDEVALTIGALAVGVLFMRHARRAPLHHMTFLPAR
jgi:hypothetical protein